MNSGSVIIDARTSVAEMPCAKAKPNRIEKPDRSVIQAALADVTQRATMWGNNYTFYASLWLGIQIILYLVFVDGLTRLEGRLRFRAVAVIEGVKNDSVSVQLTVHLMAFISFLVIACIDFGTAYFIISKSRKQLFILLSFVNLIAFFFYVSVLTGLHEPITDVNGRPLYPFRYLQWSVTTPALILLVSSLSGVYKGSRSIVALLFVDWIMIASGFLASVLPGAVGLLMAVVSFVTFAFVQEGLWHLHNYAIDNALHPDDSYKLRVIGLVTCFIWTMFPVVWGLSYLRLISPFAAELGLATSDFCAKFAYSSLLRMGSFMSLERLELFMDLDHEELYLDASNVGKRLEQTTRLLHTAEAESKEAILECGSQVKDSLLRLMSHELITPLNTIITFNSNLLDAELTSEERGQVCSALSSAESLNFSIRNIITWSDFETSGFPKLSPTVFELIPLVEAEVESQAYVAESVASLKLEWSFDERIPNGVIGDGNLLRLAFSNILNNAIKFSYTPKSVITINLSLYTEVIEYQVRPSLAAVSRRSSTASLDEGMVMLRLSVSDNGTGMDPLELKKMFVPLAQGENATRYGGLGLGLAIVQRSMTAMEGFVEVTTEINQGTDIALVFPIRALPHGTSPGDCAIMKENHYSGLNLSLRCVDKVTHELIDTCASAWGSKVVHCSEEIDEEESTGAHVNIVQVPDDMTEKSINELANEVKRPTIFLGKRPAIDSLGKKTLAVGIYYPVTTRTLFEAVGAVVEMHMSAKDRAAHKRKKQKAHRQVNALRVLIVDDAELNLKVMKAVLKKLRITSVDEATNGVIAVEHVKKGGGYDIIFMDVMMPEMDGLTATRVIRDLEARGLVPNKSMIIGVSAQLGGGAMEAMLEAGMDTTLCKPVKLQAIRQCLPRKG